MDNCVLNLIIDPGFGVAVRPIGRASCRLSS